MDKLLDDKVVFITGAGRGIGAAAARLFAAEGARLMLTARTESELAAVAKETGARYVVCDLADPDSVRAAVDRTVAEYGRLDAAFNNGAIGQPPGPMDGLSQESFDQVYAVNLRGVWSAIVAEVTASSAFRKPTPPPDSGRPRGAAASSTHRASADSPATRRCRRTARRSGP